MSGKKYAGRFLMKKRKSPDHPLSGGVDRWAREGGTGRDSSGLKLKENFSQPRTRDARGCEKFGGAISSGNETRRI